MTIKNIRIRPKGNNDFGDILHPQTNIGNILGLDGKPLLQDYTRLPGYVALGGTANTYTGSLNPAPASYIEGMKVSIKINVTNTGASTLNLNGLGAKSIKKSNGNDLISGNLKAGSVYSLIYNGVNFILQGEGGEYGTAQPSHVLSPYTIGTEEGLKTGTMINRGAVNRTLTTQGGRYTIPAGYHNGSGVVTASFANLTSSNIKKGVNIGGVVGTLVPQTSMSNRGKILDGFRNFSNYSYTFDFSPSAGGSGVMIIMYANSLRWVHYHSFSTNSGSSFIVGDNSGTTIESVTRYGITIHSSLSGFKIDAWDVT